MHREPRWRKRCGWWLLAVCFPLGIHATAQDDYAYRHALATDASSAVWQVELSPAIYAASPPAKHLRDLIVVNAQGQPVPFGPLPPAPSRTQTFTFKTALLPLPANSSGRSDGVRVQRNSDGGIVIEQPATAAAPNRPHQWLLDAGRPASLERIEIDPSALPDDAGFHISVQASNDLQHWSSAGQSSEIVNVRRGTDALTQRSISVASATPSRYYRLSLRGDDRAPWDITQTPAVELHGSVIETRDAPLAARRWLDATATATSSTTDGGTDYDYSLPAALPLEAARITLASTNTVARYRLLDHDDNADRLLISDTAIHIGSDTHDAAPTTFIPGRVQHLRLHTDTPLAQPPTLSVAWRPDVFVFLAEGSAPYSLLVGSHAARRADYPLQLALERVRIAGDAHWQPPLAALGAVSDAAGPTALVAPKPPFDWTRPLLWLVLIGGALAVIAMAWSLLRQSPGSDDAR